MISSWNSEVHGTRAAAQKYNTRILCLGNDLLADDSLGSMVAVQVWQIAPPDVQVVSTPETGFHLLDYVLNVRGLIVVDTVLTGSAPPGTIYELREADLQSAPGASTHYVGLFDALAVARYLGLSVAEQVLILAVEAADCFTIGDPMHPAVVAAIPALVNLVGEAATNTVNPAGAGQKGGGGANGRTQVVDAPSRPEEGL